MRAILALIAVTVALSPAAADTVYKCTVTGLTFTDGAAYGKHCPRFVDSNGDGLCDHLVLVSSDQSQRSSYGSYGPGRGRGVGYNVPENAVAVYAPPRYVETTCLHAIEEVLKENGIPYVEVGHGWITKYLTYGGEPTVKALILPGGSYVDELLGFPDVAEAIKEYLNAGGVVVGICAGAIYLADAGLADAKVIGSGYGVGTVEVKFTGNDPFGLWKGLPDTVEMAYMNGPIMEPTSSSAVVVAKYAGGTVKFGAAIIAEKVGDGLVVLIGPHPCHDVNGNINPEGARLLINAIEASTAETVQPQPQCTGPQGQPVGPNARPQGPQVQAAMVQRLSAEVQALRERLRMMQTEIQRLRMALASVPKPSWMDVLWAQLVGPWAARALTGIVTGLTTAAVLSYLHLEPPLSLAAGALVGLLLNVPV